MTGLPLPSEDALAHSQAMFAHLVGEIKKNGGWLSFADYMAQVLYAPGLGYYAAGAQKFGAAGDFVTAPEMTPLFVQALAPQVAEIMAASAPEIIEVGAGSGQLAADLLQALETLQALPEHYAILELSPDLQARQRETLAAQVPHLQDRVHWLHRLPDEFSGVIVANELLDALPAHLVVWGPKEISELGVSLDAEVRFTWNDRPASGELL